VNVFIAIVGPKDGEWFPVEVPEVPGVFTQGWELHIEGVGVTQSEGVEDAEAVVREYLELDGLDADAPIDITFEFRGDRESGRENLRELIEAHVAERDDFRAEETTAARDALYGSIEPRHRSVNG
jgi:predicted RNase H-like HicB family nuclease